MVIRKGSSRVVILVGRWAIKLPRLNSWTQFLWGLLANMQEARWWRDNRRWPHVDPNHRLCPVLFAVPGGLLVVMPRAYVPPNYHKHFTYAYCDTLRPMFAGLPFDPNPGNFGFIGRHLVLIDYG